MLNKEHSTPLDLLHHKYSWLLYSGENQQIRADRPSVVMVMTLNMQVNVTLQVHQVETSRNFPVIVCAMSATKTHF